MPPAPAAAAATAPPWVAAFAVHLRHERGCSAHTARAYSGDLAAVAAAAAAAGRARPEDWDADFLRAVLAGQTRGSGGRLGPASLARRHSALRAFFVWRRGGSRGDGDGPVDGLAPRRLPRRLPRPLDADAALALVRPPEATAAAAAHRAHVALVLLYGLGLRASEVVGLRDVDLDLDEGLARVLGKGGKVRQIPVPHQCLPVLRAWRARRPAATTQQAFLLGRRGRPVPQRSLARLVAAAAGRRLGRHVSPHQLRHTYATQLLAGGASLRHIQQLLGHARLTTTQRYTHVAPERLFAAYDDAHPRSRGPRRGN